MSDWGEARSEIVERIKKRMRELGLSYRGLAREIAKRYEAKGPCYTTIAKMFRGGYIGDEFIHRIDHALGVLEEERGIVKEEAAAEPTAPRRKLLDEKFKEVERSIQSATRNLEAVKFQLQQGKNQLGEAEKNVAGILSFLSSKFKQIQELKSSIQSME